MTEFEKKGWYTISVPEGWKVDEGETVALYHPEAGAGSLDLSAIDPRPLPPGQKIDVYLMLRSFLRGTGMAIEETESRRYSERGFDWASAEYVGTAPDVDGPVLWRLWMATNHDIVVFLTYACREEDKDAERATIDGMVSSLTLQ